MAVGTSSRDLPLRQPVTMDAVLEPELLSVIGTMPMSTLANFGGMSLPQDRLDEVTQEWRQDADTSAPGSEPRSGAGKATDG